MKLTETTVKAAAPPGRGSAYLWDGDLSGFGLRVYSTGRRAFVFRYTVRGPGRARRTMVLGDYGTLTVAKARKQAEKVRGKILDGGDPLAERRRDESDVTLRKFVKTFVKRSQRKSLAEDERRLEKYVLAPLGSKRMSTITRQNIANLHAKITATGSPVEANRVVQLLRALFERAKEWGNLPEGAPNPAKAKTKGLGITLNKERPRARWLKPTEVERLMNGVDADPDPYFHTFIRLLLLTGCRKSELLQARWSDVDAEHGLLKLRETKTGEAQERVLSGSALHVLQTMPREVDSDWIFPGEAGEHRRDFKRQWGRAREASGLPDVTIHDLRRTSGSYMAQAGVPIQVIGTLLGHGRNTKVTEVYAKLARSNEAEAMEALGDKLGHLLGLAEAPSPPPVEAALSAVQKAVNNGTDDADLATLLRTLAENLEEDTTRTQQQMTPGLRVVP